jgi:deoxyadenosine/deoxycytidine kinase
MSKLLRTDSEDSPEIRKVRIEDKLVRELEALMQRHPGKLLNMTNAVNYLLEAALPLVSDDLDELSDRLRQRQRPVEQSEHARQKKL